MLLLEPPPLDRKLLNLVHPALFDLEKLEGGDELLVEQSAERVRPLRLYGDDGLEPLYVCRRGRHRCGSLLGREPRGRETPLMLGPLVLEQSALKGCRLGRGDRRGRKSRLSVQERLQTSGVEPCVEKLMLQSGLLGVAGGGIQLDERLPLSDAGPVTDVNSADHPRIDSLHQLRTVPGDKPPSSHRDHVHRSDPSPDDGGHEDEHDHRSQECAHARRRPLPGFRGGREELEILRVDSTPTIHRGSAATAEREPAPAARARARQSTRPRRGAHSGCPARGYGRPRAR